MMLALCRFRDVEQFYENEIESLGIVCDVINTGAQSDIYSQRVREPQQTNKQNMGTGVHLALLL